LTTPFNQLIEAQLAGTSISYADLHRFDFKSGQRRLHGGFGTFVDGNGEQWEGIGNVGSVGAVAAGPGQAIEELVYTLTGDAAMLAHLESDAEESAGREVSRYLQFCEVRDVDHAGNRVAFRPIDMPIQIFWGRMGALRVDRPKVEAGSGNPASRTISVSVVNAFVNRRKPPSAFWSNKDQLARSSDDNIFINVSRMADATVNWPHGLT